MVDIPKDEMVKNLMDASVMSELIKHTHTISYCKSDGNTKSIHSGDYDHVVYDVVFEGIFNMGSYTSNKVMFKAEDVVFRLVVGQYLASDHVISWPTMVKTTSLRG